MHLHKAIVSRVKALITAQKQSIGIRTTLAASGMKILTYMASGDQEGPGKSLKGSQDHGKATVIVAKSLRKKGKCLKQTKYPVKDTIASSTTSLLFLFGWQ